ncbi:MAG: hypothetical protein ACOX5R_15995 [bacterium]|jgi:hypothetical protein
MSNWSMVIIFVCLVLTHGNAFAFSPLSVHFFLADIELQDIDGIDEDPIGDLDDSDWDEISGVCPAASPEEYWGHNDSGNNAEIVRFNIRGEILQEVELSGVENRDWEAMTRDSRGNIYIGDFGDNDRKRGTYYIYAFREPSPEDKEISAVSTYRFRYADKRSYNCEAFFFRSGRLYLITKEKNEKRTQVFRIDKLVSGSLLTAQKVGNFLGEAEITDAAYSPQHNLLAVLTDHYLSFYSVGSEDDLLTEPGLIIETDFHNSEGLCFDNDHLIITNEKGKIWRYPVELLLQEWDR